MGPKVRTAQRLPARAHSGTASPSQRSLADLFRMCWLRGGPTNWDAFIHLGCFEQLLESVNVETSLPTRNKLAMEQVNGLKDQAMGYLGEPLSESAEPGAYFHGGWLYACVVAGKGIQQSKGWQGRCLAVGAPAELVLRLVPSRRVFQQERGGIGVSDYC